MKHRKTKSLLAVLMSVLMVCSLFLTNDMSAWANDNDGKISFTCQSNAVNGGHIQYKLDGAGEFTSVAENSEPNSYGTVDVSSATSSITLKFEPNQSFQLDTTRGVTIRVNGAEVIKKTGSDTDGFTGENGMTFELSNLGLTGETIANSSIEVEFGFEAAGGSGGGGGGGGQPSNPGKVSFTCQSNAVNGGHIQYKLDNAAVFTQVAEDSETNSYGTVNVSGATSSITLKFEPNSNFQLDTTRGVTIRVNGAEVIKKTGSDTDGFTGENGMTFALSNLGLTGETIANSSIEVEFGFENASNPGPGGEPGPGGDAGPGASKTYSGEDITSAISFTGNNSHDGAGVPCTAIYYINGAGAQTQNNGDVTHKTSVTYPYDSSGTVEFEFANPINMRYTGIKINGVDYSGQIPGTNAETGKWDVLDAMDLNHQSQTISFILTVPYAATYDVTANIAIIGENNVSYGSGESAIAFEVRNASNGTVGYKYDTYNYPDLSTEGEKTYPTSLVQGKTLTIYAKPNDGFDLDYFGMKYNGQDVNWNAIGNPSRDDLKSPQGLSFEIPASMANGGKLDITIEFTQSEEQKAAQIAEQQIYFPTGNFLWTNLEEDKESDMFLDHTLVEFVSFTYTDRAGQTVTYNSLDDMNAANHAYLHFDGDPNRGEATLIAGGQLTVRLTPRYGYQVVQFGPNGGAFGSNPDKVAEYTFTIANGNCHLGAKCAPVSDKVTSNAEGVSNGGIEINAENADEFAIGTAVLSVDDTQPSAAEISEFETAASGYVVDSYLDLNLNNVVYRGSEESVWSTEVTELTNTATISLTVSEELSDDVKIIHQKHDGTYELLDASYDAATKTVSFETDSFSKYAIAEKGCSHDFTGQPYMSDGKGNHYQVCKVCGEKSAATACHGGTATCGTLAVCEVCGAQYGSYDTNNHVLADNRQSETCLCGKIKNINATALDSKVAAKEVAYTGSAVSPTVTIDGLTEGVDFTVEKISKTEVGEYTVTVTGIGTYTGTRSVKWSIVKMDDDTQKEDGWQKVDDQWVYYQDGKLETGWVQDGETWYYMNDTGVMQTGWVQDGETWYYMEESGAMKTGWVQDGSTWYYMENSGAMASGWVQDGSTWYYMEESGAMASGWVQDGSTWYYMEESGAMVSGWKQLGGIWYYMDASGAMKTGWLNDGGTWYYMDASGAMQTGWIIDGGTWYYLYDNGAMAHSTRIGRYYVNASGAWVR